MPLNSKVSRIVDVDDECVSAPLNSGNAQLNFVSAPLKSFSTSTIQLTFEKIYGVVTISRLLKIIGLFCKRDLQKRPYSAQETCYYMEPANRSHPKPGEDCACSVFAVQIGNMYKHNHKEHDLS